MTLRVAIACLLVLTYLGISQSEDKVAAPAPEQRKDTLREEPSRGGERSSKVGRVVGGMGYEDYDITAREFPVLEAEALEGSFDAAKRICYYFMIATPTQAGRERLYWCEMAAVNSEGDGVAEYNAGALLNEEGDRRERRRAIYWLKRAEKHGDAVAASLLKRLRREK
jgi:TPR repeat protein